jgi:outer membrane protein OmpA-like peptidoglycan-associated protein
LEKIKKDVHVVLNNIFFDTDSYVLLENSRTELEQVLRFLTANPSVRIEIGGHTDNRGEKVYNKTLSQKRAAAVVGFLQERGIPAHRMQASGFGDERPASPNDSDENRQKNRRIEFRILN